MKLPEDKIEGLSSKLVESFNSKKMTQHIELIGFNRIT